MQSVKQVTEIITEQRAIELIRTLVPYMGGRHLIIDHIGEFDKHGCRHIDAIAVIQFNSKHQITIWDKGIQFFDGDRGLNDSAVFCGPNAFTVYRMLRDWGLVS